jgi:tetratricopeptide (TPR) repeat protein
LTFPNLLRSWLMAESHREEIAKLEALYANNPEGRVFTHLAEAYRRAGELERAKEILSRGIARHSDYASAYVVLGRVMVDMGSTDDARGAFRRVLELDRHNLIALRSLGELSTDAGDATEALHYYRELLSLDPGDDRLRLTVMSLEEQARAPASIRVGMTDEAPVTASDGAAPSAAVEEPVIPVGAEQSTSGIAPREAPPRAAESTPPEEPEPLTTAGVGAESADGRPGEAEWLDSGQWARVGGDETVGSAPVADITGAVPLTLSVESAVPAAGQGTEDAARALEEDAVVTETIAELYAAQGLHSRAIDVYKALLRHRPDDPRLHERLRRSEAALAGGATRGLQVDEAQTPAGVRRGDDAPGWLERVESAWTGKSGVAGAGPTPYAWTETGNAAEDVGNGTKISDYFRGLLDWHPGAGSTPVAAQEPADFGSLAERFETRVKAPVDQPLDLATAEQEIDDGGDAEELDLGMAAEEYVEAGAVADDPFDFGPSVDEQSEVAVAGQEVYDFGASAGLRPDVSPGVAERVGFEEATSESIVRDAASESIESEAEDDEDLEMFRSWLQSLKK